MDENEQEIAETVAGLEIVLRHLLVAGLDDLIAADPESATKIIGRLDTRLRDTIARSSSGSGELRLTSSAM